MRKKRPYKLLLYGDLLSWRKPAPLRKRMGPSVDPRLPGPFSFRTWYRLALTKPNRFSPINWVRLCFAEIQTIWLDFLAITREPEWENPDFFYRLSRSRWLSPRWFRASLMLPVVYFWWCCAFGFPKFFPFPTFFENLSALAKYLFLNSPLSLIDWFSWSLATIFSRMSPFVEFYQIGLRWFYLHPFTYLSTIPAFLFFFWVGYEFLTRRNVELQPYFWDGAGCDLENIFPLYWFFPMWKKIQEMVRAKINLKVADNETELFEELYWDEDKVIRNTAYGAYYPPIFYPIFWIFWFPFRLLIFIPLFCLSLPVLFFWWLDYLYAKGRGDILHTPLGRVRRVHRDLLWLLSFPLNIIMGYFYPYYRAKIKERFIPFVVALPHKMESDWVVWFLEDEEEQLFSEMEAVPAEEFDGWVYNWRLDTWLDWPRMLFVWLKSHRTLPKPVVGLTRIRRVSSFIHKNSRTIRYIFGIVVSKYKTARSWIPFCFSFARYKLYSFFYKAFNGFIRSSEKPGLSANIVVLFNRVVDWLIHVSVNYPFSPISLIVRHRVFFPWLFNRKERNFIYLVRFVYNNVYEKYNFFAKKKGWHPVSYFSRPVYSCIFYSIEFLYKFVRPPLTVILYWSNWLALPVFILFFLSPLPYDYFYCFHQKYYLYDIMLVCIFVGPIFLLSFPPLRRWGWWDLRFQLLFISLSLAIGLDISVELNGSRFDEVVLFWLLTHTVTVVLPWYILLIFPPFVEFLELSIFFILPPSTFEWVVPAYYGGLGIFQDLCLQLPSGVARLVISPFRNVLSFIPFFDRGTYLLDLWYYYELKPYFQSSFPFLSWVHQMIFWTIPSSLWFHEMFFPFLGIHDHVFSDWVKIACVVDEFPYLMRKETHDPSLVAYPEHFSQVFGWRWPPTPDFSKFPLPPWY